MTNQEVIVKAAKPLGQKAYGSIGHLPTSRVGPSDWHVHAGQARICTVKKRDRHDIVIVQEKLDGSCVSAAKIDGKILALTRAGYHARTSPYAQHHLWADWVDANCDRFDCLLSEGQRVVGEWLALAHGTKYHLAILEPFVAFDLMTGTERMTYSNFNSEIDGAFQTPKRLNWDDEAMPVEEAIRLLGPYGYHGALEQVEGVVYRVERFDRKTMDFKVDFLAKYVRHDKQDGKYLSGVMGGEDVWNWRP